MFIDTSNSKNNVYGVSEGSYRFAMFVLGLLGLISGGVLFILAIWRDKFTKLIVRPKLLLDAVDFPGGEPTSLTNAHSSTPARYWHVEVSNEAPWIEADEVELFLTKFSIGEHDKEVEQLMPGALSIKTRRNHGASTIGYKPVVFDLFRFVDGHGFGIMLADNCPNNLTAKLTKAGRFTAFLRARANNAESNGLIVKLSWDGNTDIQRLDNGCFSVTTKFTD